MSWLSNELWRITLSGITVTLTMPTRTKPNSRATKGSKTQKETHKQKTHTGNSFWQPGDTASRCSDAASTAEMSTTSDSKFIKRTHLHFNLKCQANMHSFALKGIPIIEQTDRPGIPFVLLISHWTKMSIMSSGNFKKSQVFLDHWAHWFLPTCQIRLPLPLTHTFFLSNKYSGFSMTHSPLDLHSFSFEKVFPQNTKRTLKKAFLFLFFLNMLQLHTLRSFSQDTTKLVVTCVHYWKGRKLVPAPSSWRTGRVTQPRKESPFAIKQTKQPTQLQQELLPWTKSSAFWEVLHPKNTGMSNLLSLFHL